MKYFTFVVFFVHCALIFAQEENRFNEREIVKQQKERSEKYAKELPNSIILFRLETKAKEIEYYRKYDNLKAANSLEVKTRRDNQIIINAVRASFDICPVYFFDGASSQNVMNEKWQNVVFFSDSLTKDSTFSLDSTTQFFIAEYSITKGQYVSSNRNNEQGSQETQSSSNEIKYYENNTIRVRGFVLFDRKFVPLTQPFPYYMKLNSLSRTVVVNEKIEKWNKKIKDYISVTN